MKINYYEQDFPYIVIDNYYTKDEYNSIWEELNFLCDKSKLILSKGSATDSNDRTLKNNHSLYLDTVYNNRSISTILKVNRKLFDNMNEIVRQHPSWFFKNVKGNIDLTSLSYYEDGERYEKHHDNYVLTSLWWTHRKPKKFDGGDFIFSDVNEVIEFKDNRMIIFPSMIPHEVTEVIMDEKDLNQKFGRICLSQFLKFK